MKNSMEACWKPQQIAEPIHRLAFQCYYLGCADGGLLSACSFQALALVSGTLYALSHLHHFHSE